MLDAEGFDPKIAVGIVATVFGIMRLVDRWQRRHRPAAAGHVEIDAGELERIRAQLRECRADSVYMATQMTLLREECHRWQEKAEDWQSRAEALIAEKLALMERLLKRRGGDENT